MPEIKNIFTQGKMNQDLDSRLIPQGVYRDALNIRVSHAAGSDQGVVENNLSNKQLTSVTLGSNPNTIGMYVDSVDEKIYWFVVSDSGSYLIEYEVDSGISTIVLEDTTADILNFSTLFLITGVNLTIDSDNGVRLFNWTDNLNPLRQINIERAKSYGANNFNSAQISLIKPPPLVPVSINLSSTVLDGTQNNIDERFMRFSHRYRYLDGEYSALSPFSEIAFLPGIFSYDYAVSSNESMINAFNQVDIAFSTGSNLVLSIDVVFKDSNSNTVYIIDNFVKSEQGWIDNQEVNIEFVNNKIFKALDADQLFRLYDAVPLKAKAQEIIGNRLVFGNYTENYNIEDCDGIPVTIDFSTELVTTSITEGVPTNSLKSNRDYEIGIVYVDLQGRMSTVLSSDINTVFIPNSDCINQNQIKVTVNNLAPCWASKYRFFIKYTKPDYDVLTPSVFYNDDVFVWLLLVGNEVNKITEGEFIYVKADTQSILDVAIQTRVLEIADQDADFLANGEDQLAGTYMKVKPSGYELNEDDYEVYEFSSYDSSSNSNDNPLRSLVNVIELPVYYNIGLNDLTSGGAYTGTTDIRYIVKIFSTGTPDTYEFSNDDGSSFDDNSGAGFSITGGAQTLELGVDVTFAATTGHTDNDEWIVSAKSSSTNGIGGDENSKAYAFYKSLPSNGNINIDDVIQGGSQIKIDYRETNNTSVTESESYITSTQFANLEEWFFEETSVADDFFRDSTNVWFRRGTLTQNGGAKFFTQDPTGDMTLIVRSFGTQNNDFESRVKVYSDLTIISLAQNLIFETIPLNNNSEIFNEIGRTYDIDSSQNHLGFDSSDVDQSGISTPAELTLGVFNAFAWGNGFESYKIKDLFNATNFKLDTRPSSTIEDFRENIRLASLTYSKVYEQTTNFNGLNEFNLSTSNFKDLDDKFESIQKLYSRDTNLIVFQEDKIHRIPYTKNILFTTTGDGSVTASADILGTETSYAGEYGISTNPESFAFYGNAIYFTDVRRSVVCRLDLNGIIEISENGMHDFFEDSFGDLIRSKKIGAFDLNSKQYVLSVNDTDTTTSTFEMNCGTSIEMFEMESVVVFTLLINASTGTLTFNFTVSGSVNLTITENAVVDDQGTLTGTSSFIYDQIDTTTELIITVTPISTDPTFTLSVPCPVNTLEPVIANNDTASLITGEVLDNINVLINDVFVDPVIVTIDTPPSDGVAIVNVNKTIKYTNDGVAVQDDSLIYKIDDGNTTDTATLTFLISASGGGGGPTGQVFNISLNSYFNPAVDGEGACEFALDDTKFHDGSLMNPVIGDNVFTDVNKTIPFNGGDKYYAIDNGISIRIFTDGSITGYWVCGQGEA